METKVYSEKEKIEYTTHEQAVILPRIQFDNQPRWGIGGVCDVHNQFIEESYYDGDWATHGGGYEWNPEEEIIIEDTVVYMGMYFFHWGHFLVDLAVRLWFPAISETFDETMKIAYLGEEEPHGNLLEFFKLLGIREEQLLHITKPTRCKKVIIPQCSTKSSNWYSEEYKKMFEVVASNALKNAEGDWEKYKGKTIYFTRRNFQKAKNSEFGEELIQKCMEASGCMLLSPEKISLSEQVAIWNYADKIICINGTIPLNAAFSLREDQQLVVLNKTSLLHENLQLFLQMKKIDATFINIYREPFKRYPKSLGEGPFLLTITEELMQYLQKNEMVCPFDKKQIEIEDKRNFWNYCRAILAGAKIRWTIRMAISKLVPQKAKDVIRGRR